MIEKENLLKNMHGYDKLPVELEKLLEYQNNAKGFYSGHFELIDNGYDSLLAFFDDDKTAASDFIVFGCDKDGSLYGYWIKYEKNLNKAPIVFNSSEGSICIIANVFSDFLTILSLGIEDLGYAIMNNAEIIETSQDPELQKFREFLKNDLKINLRKSVNKIIEETQEINNKCQEWYKGWFKQHFNTDL